MSDPVAILSLAASTAGALAQQRSAAAAAEGAEHEARFAAREAAREEAEARRDALRRLGRRRANIGRAGLALTGSPLDVLADDAAELSRDVGAVRRRGEFSSKSARLSARAARDRAQNLRRQNFLTAGQTLLEQAPRLPSARIPVNL